MPPCLQLLSLRLQRPHRGNAGTGCSRTGRRGGASRGFALAAPRHHHRYCSVWVRGTSNGGSVSFFLNREVPIPKQVSKEGFVTFDTKPTGASVLWNGQTIGTAPLTGFHLPVGQQTLELRSPGYASKVVEVTISDGTINILVVVALARDNGQFVVKTNPPGVPFEITGTDQKTTSGITPLTVDNMPTGKYRVTLRRPGWPESLRMSICPKGHPLMSSTLTKERALR